MMAVHPCAQLWLAVCVVVVLSVVDRSCGMGCNETLTNDDFTSILVKTYLNTDVEQIEIRGRPDETCNSAYIFSPHTLQILPEVMRMLLIHQRWHRRNKISAMINESVLSANYNVYKTIFEAKAGEWMLFSGPAFTGRSVTINPCYGKIRIPFTVKSVKPVSAKGIKQYRGEYFVSLMDFNMWMSNAYPTLPLDDNSMFMYLNQMLWFDLVTEIFRDEGGLIRISEDGGVFPDHPFSEPPPPGQTTLFFTTQLPSLLPNEPPVTRFQSALNQFNFLGVRETNGVFELISNSDGSEESEFILETSGFSGFSLLKSRIFCVYVVVDTSGPMPVFELIRDPDEAELRGSFILI